MLVRLLNAHPRIFITHESDVIWTLFQSRMGLPEQFAPYPDDGDLGMRATLKSAAAVYQSMLTTNHEKSDLVKAFFRIQDHLMKNGSDVQQRRPGKSGLAWVGDKKPAQYADPELRQFILELFPDAHFLHVIRNPCAVYRSMKTAVQDWGTVPDSWKGTAEDIFTQWLGREKWVQQARNEAAVPIHSMRYEDIVNSPVEQLRACFNWLGLDMTAELKGKIREMVRKPHSMNEPQPQMSAISGLEALMNQYGYKLDGSVGACPVDAGLQCRE